MARVEGRSKGGVEGRRWGVLSRGRENLPNPQPYPTPISTPTKTSGYRAWLRPRPPAFVTEGFVSGPRRIWLCSSGMPAASLRSGTGRLVDRRWPQAHIGVHQLLMRPMSPRSSTLGSGLPRRFDDTFIDVGGGPGACGALT